MPFDTFFVSFLTGLISVTAARLLGLRLNLVSRPRTDRWNRGVVPVLGGVGVFSASALALGLTGAEAFAEHWGLLAGAGLMFLLGLFDDVRELSPPVKLSAQIVIATLVVFSGYRTGFFDSNLLNILLTVAWLVGITNAINLLDNMDGLAGGIALISAGFLSFFFWRSGTEPGLLLVSAALFGGILAFLVFNFPPAKIFMGDSGSLLFGFTLAALAIARTPQASNVFAVLGVPLLLFLLPILDTLLVTITRLMRGQSPAHGGRDHTSHRLVAFGLSERQTVLVLYGVAVLSGSAGALVESFDYTLSLVLIPILLVVFAVLAAYLSRLKVVETERRDGAFTNLLHQLANRRLFEIVLDFFLASIAYYLAWFVRSGFSLTQAGLDALVRTLPVVVASTYTAYFLFGVYRGLWQYIGLRDLLRLSAAAAAAVALTGALGQAFFPQDGISLGRLFLFAVFLFLGLAASRTSFRLLDEISQRQIARPAAGGTRVLVYGANENADIVLRALEFVQSEKLQVVGFLDDDPYTWGRRIHGVEVVGGVSDATRLLRDLRIGGVIVAPGAAAGGSYPSLQVSCADHGVWLKTLDIRLTVDVSP